MGGYRSKVNVKNELGDKDMPNVEPNRTGKQRGFHGAGRPKHSSQQGPGRDVIPEDAGKGGGAT